MNLIKNTKKAFTLFELLLVVFISSIILIYSFNFQKELFEIQTTNEDLAILKIDLNSSKIIIEKNLPNIESKITYKDSILYYENNILLKDVSLFQISKTSNILIIDITLKNKISQTWKFKI